MNTFFIWFSAFIIVLTIISFILLIPSFISAYKMSFKKYFNNIKLLIKVNKSLKFKTESYVKVTNRTIQFTYQDGTKGRKFNTVEYDYFLPIYLSPIEVYILYKKVGDYFRLSKYLKNNKWKVEDTKIKNTQCIITMFLYDIFDKRVKNINNKSIQIENLDDVDVIINKTIKSIDREYKLKKVLSV